MRFYRFEKGLVNLDNIKYIDYKIPYGGFDPYYSIHFLDEDTLAISEEAYEEMITYLKMDNDVKP